MNGDQELLDYVAGLEGTLRDANMMIWCLVESEGGEIRVPRSMVRHFQAETSVLTRWTEPHVSGGTCEVFSTRRSQDNGGVMQS